MPRTPDPAPLPSGVRTLTDFQHWLGDIELDRILLRPSPGMANVNDVLRVQRNEDRLCELVCGALIEKRLGYKEASVAALLLASLEPHVAKKQLGVVTGPEGSYRLGKHLVRMPAVAFVAAGSYPGDIVPGQAAPETVPQLVAEVADGSNAAEVARRLHDYFGAGIKTVWVIELDKQSVAIFSSPSKSKTIPAGGTLEGGKTIPGFKLPVKELFEHMEAGRRRK
jgi:Uma2 family endonuclease